MLSRRCNCIWNKVIALRGYYYIRCVFHNCWNIFDRSFMQHSITINESWLIVIGCRIHFSRKKKRNDDFSFENCEIVPSHFFPSFYAIDFRGSFLYFSRANPFPFSREM